MLVKEPATPEPATAAEGAPPEGSETAQLEQRILSYVNRIDDVGRRASSPAQRNPTLVDDASTLRSAPTLQVDPPTAAVLPTAVAGDPPSPPAKVAAPAHVSASPLAPPRLESVQIRPAGAAVKRDAAPAVEVPTAANAALRASGAGLSFEQVIEQWQADSPDSSFGTQLDARVMRVVAGDYAKAREPLTLVTQAQQEIATRFIEALIAMREGHLGDPGAAASTALREVEQLVASLRQASDLRIPTVAICREVRGFGQYQTFDPPHFPAGVASEFVAYVEVREFQSRQGADGWWESRFDLQTAVLSRAGDTILNLTDPEIVDRCRNRRQDCFIPRLVRLPATLAPGEYVLKLTVVDKLGEKVAECRATFRVVSRA